MKKILTKVFGLVLSLAVAASSLVPASALAADSIYAPKEVTYYMSSNQKDCIEYNSFSISGLTKDQKIKKSTVKTSNKSVAALSSLERTKSSYEYETEFFDSTLEPYNSNSEFYSYSINFESNKIGKSTIKYKIDNKEYKTVVNVKKYTNPLKNVTIKGINNGKNIASKLKNVNVANLTLKKNVTDATINVKANSGWKITAIYINVAEDTGNGYKTSIDEYAYYSNSNGRSSVKMIIDNLDKTKSYTVMISSTNTKTGGSISSAYIINY